MEVAYKLEVMGCRIFQAVLKIGNYGMGYRMPQYLEGPGRIRELGAFLREKGINDVLVVTGSGMVRRGQVQPMLDGFAQAGIRYFVQTFDHPDPTSQDVETGFAAYNAQGCRAIVALGRKTVAQLQGLLEVHKPIVPLVAIPTTAGAGSETTVAAVITDSNTHRKAAINDPCLIPRYAVLDPELTVGLPPETTATTGMDALAHAVEAYTNHTYNTKLEDRLAKEAVELIHHNLLTAYAHGEDLEARQNMQWGAFYAGRAFTRGCVGYVHAIGHTLGGLYGVSHGLAMAVLLPHVMRAYGPAVYGRLAELARVCGIPGDSDRELAEGFIRWIEDTNEKMGLPKCLAMIREEDIQQMVTWAKKEANPLYPVPVVWGRQQLEQMIRSIRL